MKTRTFAAVSAGLGGAVLAAVLFAQEAAPYVATRKIDHMDDYHGTKVADPYRWLEDETSPADGRVDRGAERRHVPVSRAHSLSRSAARARHGAQRLRALRRAGAQGPVFLLQQERRPAEPERAAHSGRPRGRARGAARSELVVRRRHGAALGVRAVEGREVRRLRHLAERLRLAAVQSHGARDEAHARGQRRVGQGVAGRVARRRLLLQPLSRAAGRPREGVDQREPSGVLPQARHAAGGRHARVRGPRESAAFPYHVHDRGRALR